MNKRMKLLVKFSLVFILVFGGGLGCAAWFAHSFLRTNATDQVLQNAELMMETATAMRTYTTKQIAPQLTRDELRKRIFFPQTVPAYAATESFNYLRVNFPDYSYKEATLNPTDLRDRPADWESDIIRTFRDDPGKKRFIGHRDTPTGVSWFLARPIVAGPACMECHSIPARAPAPMLAVYGSNNGFGWKLNEVVGAQIVSVPAALPIAVADRAFRDMLIYVGATALLTLVALDLALILIVIRPVSKLSAMADRISKGDTNVEELPVKGSDEISILAGSFNRMQLSLAKAIKLLES
jgi:protein-histidine pros-kinase